MWPFRRRPLPVNFMPALQPSSLCERVAAARDRLDCRGITATWLEMNRAEFGALFGADRFSDIPQIPSYWGRSFERFDLVDGPTRVGGMRPHGRYEVVPWVWEVAPAPPAPPKCQVVQVGVKFPGVPVANRVQP